MLLRLNLAIRLAAFSLLLVILGDDCFAQHFGHCLDRFGNPKTDGPLFPQLRTRLYLEWVSYLFHDESAIMQFT